MNDSSATDDSAIWIIGSGATSQMLNNLKWFCNFESSSNKVLSASIDSTLKSKGTRSVKVKYLKNYLDEMLFMCMT